MKGYERIDTIDNFEGIAKSFVEETQNKNIAVEPSPEKAKHMIKNDLRDAIPPQLYALISKITASIEAIGEVEQKRENTPLSHPGQGQNSHSRIDKNKV